MNDKSPEYMYRDGSIIDFESGFRMMVGEQRQNIAPVISGLGKSRIGNNEHSKDCGCLVCKRRK